MFLDPCFFPWFFLGFRWFFPDFRWFFLGFSWIFSAFFENASAEPRSTSAARWVERSLDWKNWKRPSWTKHMTLASGGVFGCVLNSSGGVVFFFFGGGFGWVVFSRY